MSDDPICAPRDLVAQPLPVLHLTHRERSTSFPGRRVDDAMTSGSEFTSGKPAMQRMDGYPGPEWMGPIDPRLPELRPLIWPNGVRHKAEHPTGLHGTLTR